MNTKTSWLLELNKKFLIAALSAVIILVAVFVWWTAVRADRDARAELLQQAQLAAHTIDARNVQTLTGSGMDLHNPDYRQIKKLLATVRDGTPQCRFAYLLGRKADGTLFFLADSEPETSKDYSPPGQIFEESTPEVRGIFNNGQGLTEGPVADRWGTWVSALAPITAGHDRAVVAVFGIDIDASAWNWKVAYRAAATLGLLLVLLAGLIIILVKSHRTGVSARPVIRRLMLPLGFIVISLIAGSIVLMWQQQQRNLKVVLRDDLVDVLEDMHAAIEQQASGLTAAAMTIAANPAVQKALRENNVDTLPSAWLPVFEQMRRKVNLTHFNFLDKNRVCLLRLARPELRGDLIDRFTAVEAERTGRTAFGIELGGADILALRVVQPVSENGRLAGYVELGKSISEVMRTLHNRSDVQLALSIRKDCLDRRNWEEWMRMSGRKADWNSLPASVLFYSGNERMAEVFSSSADIVHGETASEIVFDGRPWRISAMPLSEASGREIGHLLSMRDISADKQEFSHLFIFGATGGILLLGFLLGFIYLLLFRTDRKIVSQQLILQGSEERLSQLAEQSSTVAWEVDAGGMYTYISDVVKKVLGYSPEDIVGRLCFYDLHPESGREEFKAAALAVFERKEPFINLVNRVRARDGHSVWVSTNGIPILDTDGTLLGYRGADVDITERKLTEEALRETRDYLDNLFNHSNTPIIIWDSKFRITQFNNAFEKLSGRKASDVLGKQVDILFPAETREHSIECIRRTTGGERWDVVEIQIQHTDGNVYTLLWNSATIYSTDNTTIIGTIAQGYDITGRKQAENALRESNELNRSMLQTIPFGMDIVDEDGNILFLNENMTKLIGSDAVGEKCWSVYRDDKLPCHDCPLQTGIGIGSTEIYETGGVLGGRIFQIIHTGMLFHGKKAMLEIFQDITERRHAEDALKNSEEQNRTILQTAMDGFWKADMQGRLLEVNDTYARISGYSVEELLTMRISDLELNEKPEDVADHMRKIISRSARRFETRHRRKDGTFVDVEVSVNYQPEFNLFVAFIRDITERLKIQHDLVNAKEHAEESDRLKTAFLNNISHEIRTPFNCILGFLALLDDNTLSGAERSEYVSMINQAAERLMNAINDIVEMSKIQTGQVKVTLVETDINKLAGEVSERFEPQAKIKNLTFTLKNSLTASDCSIKTDDDKLNSVLGILISNAIKFTMAGSVELGIQRNNNWLEFYVKDTGVGIPEDKRHRIFKHFMQADVSNTRKFEGSGLGLSIAKAYVEMLGGRIGFDSHEGRGSTFHFTIPAVNDSSKLSAGHENPVQNGKHPLSLKILVTEDDDVNFEYLNAVLIRAGYEVIHARTGAEAVEICRGNMDIGTILMDIKMPVMDGYIATREIRKFNPSVPIIAITAYAETGDRKKCLEAGMNDFASKPVTPRDMMDVLDKWLSRENAG